MIPRHVSDGSGAYFANGAAHRRGGWLCMGHEEGVALLPQEVIVAAGRGSSHRVAERKIAPSHGLRNSSSDGLPHGDRERVEDRDARRGGEGYGEEEEEGWPRALESEGDLAGNDQQVRNDREQARAGALARWSVSRRVVHNFL